VTAWLLLGLLLAPAAWPRSVWSAANDRIAARSLDNDSDLSELEIFFKLVDGRLLVNRETSKLNDSPRFKSRLSKNLSPDAVKKSLFDDLDRILKKNEKVFVYSLPTAIRQRYATDVPFRQQFEATAETRGVNEFNGTDWPRFQAAFKQWHDKYKVDLDPPPLPLAGGLIAELRSLSSSLNNTPLSFDVLMDADVDVDETGKIKVHVADPIGDLTEDDYSIVVPVENGNFAHKDKITPTADSIRKALAPLKGQLWRSERIRTYVADFFAGSDFPRTPESRDIRFPALHVDEANALPKVIEVGKIGRIARIDLMKFDDRLSMIDLVVRQLFDDSTFRTFIRKQHGKDATAQPLHLVTPENLPPFHFIYLDTLTGKGGEPHYSPLRLAAQAAILSKLGYVIDAAPYDPSTDSINGEGPTAASEDGGPLYVRLLIFKKAEDTSESTGSTEASASGPSSTAATSLTDGSATPVASPSPSPTPAKPPDKPKLNFLGVDFFYKPDQGVKLSGIYKRQGLLNTENGNGDLTVRVGNRDEHFIVTGDFSGDNLLFRKLHRRLSVDLFGSSDFEVRRLFFNTKTDERRQSSLIRGEWELFTRPQQLTVFLEASGGTVELIQNDVSVSKQRLNSLSFGGSYVLKTDEVVPLRSLQFEPKVRFGLALAKNEPGFTMFSLRGVFQHHRDIPARFGIQISGRVDVASKGTPIFELPSFGGVDSVRGFREDDAIGRRLWSLQNEIRTPILGLPPDAEGFKKFLRNQTKVAAFIDVGAMSDTVGTRSGLRAGPGLGLRVNFMGVNMKIDYAYGLGDAAIGKGRGRFHFSLDTPLRF